jgi:hypothetical protein
MLMISCKDYILNLIWLYRFYRCSLYHSEFVVLNTHCKFYLLVKNLSLCLPLCLTYISMHLYVCLTIQSVNPSIIQMLSIHPQSMYLFISPSIYLSVYLNVCCLSVYVAGCLFICMYVLSACPPRYSHEHRIRTTGPICGFLCNTRTQITVLHVFFLHGAADQCCLKSPVIPAVRISFIDVW